MGITVTKLAQLTGHKDAIFGLDVSDDGKVYSGGGDGYVVQWAPDAYENGDLVTSINKSIYAVRVFGNLLFAGNAIGELAVIDLDKKEALVNRKVSPGGIFDFYAAGNQYYVFGEKGTVTVLDAAFNTTGQVQFLDQSIRQAIPGPEDTLILACSDNTVKIIQRETLALVRQVEAHQNSVFSIALDAVHNRLYTGSRDATIKVWDMDNLNEVSHIPAHLYHVNGLALNPEFPLLLSASMDKTIKLWDTAEMRLLKVVDLAKFGLHTNSVNKVLWIGSNRFISCSDDRSLGYFQVEF